MVGQRLVYRQMVGQIWLYRQMVGQTDGKTEIVEQR